VIKDKKRKFELCFTVLKNYFFFLLTQLIEYSLSKHLTYEENYKRVEVKNTRSIEEEIRHSNFYTDSTDTLVN
jgi:hypothetical protein